MRQDVDVRSGAIRKEDVRGGKCVCFITAGPITRKRMCVFITAVPSTEDVDVEDVSVKNFT